MKIVICGSIIFSYEMDKLSKELISNGHEVVLPLTAEKIIDGKLSLEEFKREKNNSSDAVFRKIKDDLIKRYYNIIKTSDAILVVNYTKNNVENYIGGNTFLEMGFAHVLNKPIYLLNNIPKMPYTDEIKAIRPIILYQDLTKIK